QGQARARVRLCRCRLSLAQERCTNGCWLTLARSFQRRWRAAACRRLRELHGKEATRAGRIPRILPSRRSQRSPLERLGRACTSEWRSRPPQAGRPDRLEPGQGLVLGAVTPELVVEVAYDHMQGNRFRHTAQFRRWRTDKKPSDCTYAQLEVIPPEE